MAFNANYTFNFEPGDLTLSASYVWRDVQDGTIFDRAYDNTPSWDDVDLRALWKAKDDRYEVIGFVKNVFNTLQYEAADEGEGLLGTNATSTTAGGGPGRGQRLQPGAAADLRPSRCVTSSSSALLGGARPAFRLWRRGRRCWKVRALRGGAGATWRLKARHPNPANPLSLRPAACLSSSPAAFLPVAVFCRRW